LTFAARRSSGGRSPVAGRGGQALIMCHWFVNDGGGSIAWTGIRTSSIAASGTSPETGGPFGAANIARSINSTAFSLHLVPDLGTLWAETEVSAPVAGVSRLHLAGHIDNVLSMGARKRLGGPLDQRYGQAGRVRGRADEHTIPLRTARDGIEARNRQSSRRPLRRPPHPVPAFDPAAADRSARRGGRTVDRQEHGVRVGSERPSRPARLLRDRVAGRSRRARHR
jgi:hypothetical protein